MVEFVIARYTFKATEPEELSLEKGERYQVIKKDEEYSDGWWEVTDRKIQSSNNKGQDSSGNLGLFPASYTELEKDCIGAMETKSVDLVNDMAKVIGQYRISQDSSFYNESDDEKDYKQKTANKWTSKEVADFLESNGLEKFCDSFVDNDVHGEIFLNLDHNSLKDIGVKSFGHRWDILKLIHFLKSQAQKDTNSMQFEKPQLNHDYLAKLSVSSPIKPESDNSFEKDWKVPSLSDYIIFQGNRSEDIKNSEGQNNRSSSLHTGSSLELSKNQNSFDSFKRSSFSDEVFREKMTENLSPRIRNKNLNGDKLKKSLKKRILGRSKTQPSGVVEGLQSLKALESCKNSDCSGWMKKRGETLGVWKNRFFVLKGTRLSYFYSEDDTTEKGLIDITSHRIAVIDKFFYGAKYCIKLYPPAPGAARAVTFTPPKEHFFALESKHLLKKWHAAFLKVSIGRDLSVPVISTSRVPTISLAKAKKLNSLTTRSNNSQESVPHSPFNDLSKSSTNLNRDDLYNTSTSESRKHLF